MYLQLPPVRGNELAEGLPVPGPGPLDQVRRHSGILAHPGARAQTPMPGPWTRSVNHVAAGHRQVMATDRNEQSVINWLQSAQIAEWVLIHRLSSRGEPRNQIICYERDAAVVSFANLVGPEVPSGWKQVSHALGWGGSRGARNCDSSPSAQGVVPARGPNGQSGCPVCQIVQVTAGALALPARSP